MKATEAKLLSFLQKSPQFVIPIYQRTCDGVEVASVRSTYCPMCWASCAAPVSGRCTTGSRHDR